MKKLCFFLILISLSFLGVKCQCNDCSDSPNVELYYGVVNQLIVPIDLQFGDNPHLIIQLLPGDKSELWNAFLKFRSSNDILFHIEGGFPVDADVIKVLHMNDIIAEFSYLEWASSDNADKSIYNWGQAYNYEKREENRWIGYYELDSINLNLK